MSKTILALVVALLAHPAFAQGPVPAYPQGTTLSGKPGPMMQCAVTTGAPSYTTGQINPISCTIVGGVRIVLIDPTTGASLTPGQDATAGSAALATGPQIMGDCDDTSTVAGVENAAARFRVDCLTRAVYARQLDPCSAVAKTTDPISITTDTVIIAATSAKKNYICALVVVAGAAEIVSVTEGTGSVCATSEAALVGSTTDANGMSFAANGGAAMLGSGSTVIAGKTANVDTCLNVSGSNRVSGFVTWVQAP